MLKNIKLFSVQFVENPLRFVDGHFLLSLNVLDYKDNFIASVNEGEIHMNPDYRGTVNYDQSTIEVLDSLNNVAFSIDLLDSNKMSIQGYFKNPEETWTFVGKILTAGELNDDKSVKIAAKGAQIEKIFDYSVPGRLGVRVKTN